MEVGKRKLFGGGVFLLYCFLSVAVCCFSALMKSLLCFSWRLDLCLAHTFHVLVDFDASFPGFLTRKV